MKDRVPLYPGRVTLTPVAGQANTYDMVRADQPTQEGTPLNKANLLADDVAAKLGLTGDPTPNDALDALADQKASKQQAAADAGKFWKIGTDGLLVFDSPVAKFSQGPLIITESQTLDLSQYGLQIGDQINVVVIGGGGGGGGAIGGSSNSTTGGGSNNRTRANNGRGYGAGGGGGTASTRASTVGYSGGGGGACGAINAKTVTLTSTSVVCTIGSMGAGGTSGSPADSESSGVTGKNGGTTSFGAYLSAAGGKGGDGGHNSNGTYTGGAGATGQHNGGNGGKGGTGNPWGGGGGAGGWIVVSSTEYSGTDGQDASSLGVDGAGGTPNGIINAGDGAILIWW